MGPHAPSGRRDSNPRPSPWQGDALPAEPRPQTTPATRQPGGPHHVLLPRVLPPRVLLLHIHRRRSGKQPCGAIRNSSRVFLPARTPVTGAIGPDLHLRKTCRQATENRPDRGSPDQGGSARWAVLGSNQRPLPCQGSALPLRQPPPRWVRDLNPCTRICSPLPRLSATPPGRTPTQEGSYKPGTPGLNYRRSPLMAPRARPVPSGRRDSNPRPSPWQGDALPAEPRPQQFR